ncbi:MAG: hypothetical protein JOS17DRAFT_476929 [Linnemannia elongata]|nr:MAG: hypothetical protein JOS17DRAFT_476929 [Linnemannia elongata]
MFHSRDTDRIVRLEGLVFPKVRVLEVLISEWSPADLDRRWTFLDMFPNLKRHSIDFYTIPLNLDEDADTEQQRRLRRLEQRLEQKGVPSLYLTNLATSINSQGALSQLCTFMDIPPTFTIPSRTATLSSTTPIAITQYPFSQPPLPPLGSLTIDIESRDYSGAVSDILNHVGVSLKELRCKPDWTDHWDIDHFFSVLTSDCCSDLVLAVVEDAPWDNGYFWLLELLMAPVPVPTSVPAPVPVAMVPSLSPASSLNPNPSLDNNITTTTSNDNTASDMVPVVSTLNWTKTLTEFRLGSFLNIEGYQYADLSVIPRLNRILRLLKNLVVFELKHTLKDLELFNGIGRIPVRQVKYECERETEYKEREEKEKEREKEGGGVCVETTTVGECGDLSSTEASIEEGYL